MFCDENHMAVDFVRRATITGRGAQAQARTTESDVLRQVFFPTWYFTLFLASVVGASKETPSCQLPKNAIPIPAASHVGSGEDREKSLHPRASVARVVDSFFMGWRRRSLSTLNSGRGLGHPR